MAKFVLGMDIMYHSGVSVSGAEKVRTEKSLRKLAKKTIEEREDIKYIRLYRVDWTDDSEWGKTTELGEIKGKDKYRNPWKDPKFVELYNKLAREQD